MEESFGEPTQSPTGYCPHPLWLGCLAVGRLNIDSTVELTFFQFNVPINHNKDFGLAKRGLERKMPSKYPPEIVKLNGASISPFCIYKWKN